MRAMRPKTEGILESSLYVSDLPRSVRFYEDTFGFRVISDFGERGCAMHADTHQVLLLFKKGASRTIQSPHDGGTASYMLRSLSRPTNWPTGNPGSKREESRWKKSGSGNWEAGASTSETRTAI
jgi:catechol 2,3-dioxygenase-like lactoylglutathione lyase family enzyme